MAQIKHGKWGSSTYWSWAMMKQRCLNQAHTSYPYYGGRGISLHPDWVSFEGFLSDMGEKPSPSHSIDRIDPNGNYEPSNCRWATKLEQTLNRGDNRNNTSGYRGVSSTKSGKWRAYVMVDRKQVNLGVFEAIEDAAAARRQYDTDNQR